MKKQLQLIMPALLMVLSSLIGYGQNVNDQFDIDGYEYKITSLTPPQVEVVDYTGSATEVTILATVSHQGADYQVTAIGDHAFDGTEKADSKKLTSVTIPDGVTSIGFTAFANNLLTKVDIPNSVTSIDRHGFEGNQLTELTISNSLTIIKWGAFARNQLTSVTIPGSMTSINAWAFWQNQLTSVTIPDGVTDIGNAAFADNQLTGIAIPGSVESIGEQVFYNNPGLGLVTVEGTDPPSLQGNAFADRGQIDLIVPVGTREDYLNEGWTGFRSITFGIFTDNDIKYGITSTSPAEAMVMDYTGSATAVEIPETVDDNGETYTVTAIGANAFNDNPDLATVKIGVDQPLSLHENAFADRSQIDLIVPVGTREDYLNEGWTRFRSIIFGIFTDNDIKYGITSVNPNEVMVIDYIGSATAVEIPETVDDNGETYAVTAIGANAFSDNPDLTTVKIEAAHPLKLHENAFTDRGQIDLIVPIGQRQAYLDNRWYGFGSITEEAQILSAGSNIEFRDFTLYPNPARDKVHIDIDPRSGQELKQVNIYTMTGAYLHSENGPEINTGRLSEGMYLFEIVTETGDRSVRRVIIQ